MRVAMGELKGVNPDDLAEYYIASRAEGTLSTYGSAFKRVWAHAVESHTSLFRWGEGEVMGLLIRLEKEGVGENMIKQVMAVISLVFECMGRDSPSKSDLVSKVRKTCVKRVNQKKEAAGPRRLREGLTLEQVMVMVRDVYKVPASRAEPARRRFLVMQLLLFFGVKRFSDIAGLKVKDISFRKDGSVEVFMRKSKTDQMARGASFFLSGRRKGGVCLPEILKWYIKGFDLKSEDVVFPRFRNGGEGVVPIKGISVSYKAAAEQLKAEVKRLGFGNISLHSGRIGAATAGARAGMAREQLKACGGWRFDAVDGYIRVESGIVFTDKMLDKVL